MTDYEKRQLQLLYELRAMAMELSAEQEEKLRALEETFIRDEVEPAVVAHVLPLLRELHGAFRLIVEQKDGEQHYDVRRMNEAQGTREYVRSAAPTPAAQEPTSQPPCAADQEGRRPRFRFSMVGISIGEWITFIPTGLRVKVVGDQTVEYDGRQYKLSPFVREFMPAHLRNGSGAYQGSKYFSHQGRTLDVMRADHPARPGRKRKS